jgi:hypothetical protein
MRPDPEMIPVLIDTAKTFKASQRRLFMTKTVAARGSTHAPPPSMAKTEFGRWCCVRRWTRASLTMSG